MEQGKLTFLKKKFFFFGFIETKLSHFMHVILDLENFDNHPLLTYRVEQSLLVVAHLTPSIMKGKFLCLARFAPTFFIPLSLITALYEIDNEKRRLTFFCSFHSGQ